jgi:hypothetical protein
MFFLDYKIITPSIQEFCLSIKYNQGDKNRVGDLGEHVRAMRELRNAFRREQVKTKGKKSLG